MSDRYEVWELDENEPLEVGNGVGPSRLRDSLRLGDGSIRNIDQEIKSIENGFEKVIFKLKRKPPRADYAIDPSISMSMRKSIRDALNFETFSTYLGFENNVPFSEIDLSPTLYRRSKPPYLLVPRVIIGLDSQEMRDLAKRIQTHALLFNPSFTVATYIDAFLENPTLIGFEDNSRSLYFSYKLNDFLSGLLRSKRNILQLPATNVITSTVKHFDEIFRMIRADPDELEKLDPRKLEQLIAELFSREGWTVFQSEKLTRDGGLDGVVTRTESFGEVSYIYEVKSKPSGKSLGVDIIRSFNTVIGREHSNGGILCAASKISPDAIEEAKHYRMLYLQDADKLHERIRNIT